VLEARERGLEQAMEAKKKEIMAPLVKLEDEIKLSALKFGVGVGVGGVGLAAVRQFVRPLEEAAQKVLLASIAVGLIYGAATYGPKAVAVYQILNDETTKLEKAVR
jgi:hypothetical protein